MNKIKIGTVQVNNSFSGQNYLPLSLGFLYSHAKEYASNFKKKDKDKEYKVEVDNE